MSIIRPPDSLTCPEATARITIPLITAVPDTRKKRIVVLYNLIKCIFIVLLETRCGHGTCQLVVIVISIRILPAARHRVLRHIARAGDGHRLRIPLRDHPLARQVQRVRIQSAAGLPRGRSHRRPQSILYSQNSFTLSNKINRISLSLEILEQYPYVCLFFLGNKKTFIWQIIRRRKDRFCCYSYMFVNIKVYSLKIYRMRLSKLKRAEN